MATTITMPQLGETVTEGTVAHWLKRPGDAIEKYEAFVEVSTDKVNAEVPSPVSGTVVKLHASEGDTVAVGALLAEIAPDGAPAAPATNGSGNGTAAAPPAVETPLVYAHGLAALVTLLISVCFGFLAAMEMVAPDVAEDRVTYTGR